VRDLLKDFGVDAQVVDTGCLGRPAFAADISRDAVFAAAGTSLIEMIQRGDRGAAVTQAALGATKIISDLHAAGKVDGVLGLGGSAGTAIATSAMRALPLGVPKLMVSTLASGQTRPYVGGKDILMLNSVVDISGINRISRTVLGEAARAMAGMVKLSTTQRQAGSVANDSGDTSISETIGRSTGSTLPGSTELAEVQPLPGREGGADRPLVAATMLGVTTPCVQHAQKILEEAGYEVLVFHATGNGGEAMEGLIADGLIAGVLDITTTELAD
jgi:uncharacterized protein (UPF0261 family)